MNRFILVLAFSLMLLGIPNVHARNSAASYDNNYWSQQEFVQAYNASTATIYRDYVVGLYTFVAGDGKAIPTINPNSNLGQFVTENTGSTTDSIYVFGVADETIPSGQLGRICIRGAHKVVFNPADTSGIAIGMPISQCKYNLAQLNTQGASFGNAASSTLPQNGGVACQYSTATGTAGGTLGFILNTTATTDTGDAGQASPTGNNTTGSEYWTWIAPQVLR